MVGLHLSLIDIHTMHPFTHHVVNVLSFKELLIADDQFCLGDASVKQHPDHGSTVRENVFAPDKGDGRLRVKMADGFGGLNAGNAFR